MRKVNQSWLEVARLLMQLETPHDVCMQRLRLLDESEQRAMQEVQHALH